MNTPYASLELTESSPEQTLTEVFDVATIRAFLGLPSVPDPALDIELTGYITAAREVGEIFQGRDLCVKQWDMRMDHWYAGSGNGSIYSEITLRPSLVSVDLVEYTNNNGVTSTAVEGTDYVLDRYRHPGVIMPPYGKTFPVFIPRPNSAVLIRFTSGWTAAKVPQLVKQGMQLLISGWFNNKIPFEIGAGTMMEYPMAVTHCLSYGQIPRHR